MGGGVGEGGTALGDLIQEGKSVLLPDMIPRGIDTLADLIQGDYSLECTEARRDYVIYQVAHLGPQITYAAQAKL